MFYFSSKKATRRRDMKAAAAAAAGRRPKLDRRNASKNIDYEASFASTSSDESTSLRTTRSLDHSPVAYSSQTSFRIGGSVEGEVELLCRSLGLSGPDDFAISAAAWEASLKARSSSDIFPRSRLLYSDSLPPQPENPTPAVELPAEACTDAAVLSEDIGVRPAAEAAMLREEIRFGDDETFPSPPPPDSDLFSPHVRSVLALTPSMAVPVDDRPSLTSDRADVPLLSREIGLRSTAESAVFPEEIAVRYEEPAGISWKSAGRSYGGDGGIRGVRPPVLTTPPLQVSVLSAPLVRSILAPPPSMTLPLDDRSSSSWDLVRSFAPVDENEEGDRRRLVYSDNDEEEEEEEGEEEGEEEEERVVNGGAGEVLEEERGVILGETSDGIGSFSTSNDDDSSSSTTTEFVISPNGRFKKKIKSWMRGQLLGSGSFGTVYEGISDDGTFIAVKEVSLLEKGSSAQQCILQLEQEIALLSQFEHENIVQYYGTDKEESKLFIFLELVTQGSIASTYQKYHLRDTQVSAYTRQILNGLNYLHERDVVHRDIKCANILVHANGSVKLADFGLAKEISKFNDLKSCKGSVYWMAPEVINPRKTYGRAADIWSLGCTVLEMLTRQIPFPNVEWQHAFYRIGRGDQPPIPSHLSRHAQDFIRQCTQVDPNSRPTAAQLLEHPFARRPPCNY